MDQPETGLSNKQYAYLTNSIDPLELPETRAVECILHSFGLLFGTFSSALTSPAHLTNEWVQTAAAYRLCSGFHVKSVTVPSVIQMCHLSTFRLIINSAKSTTTLRLVRQCHLVTILDLTTLDSTLKRLLMIEQGHHETLLRSQCPF